MKCLCLKSDVFVTLILIVVAEGSIASSQTTDSALTSATTRPTTHKSTVTTAEHATGTPTPGTTPTVEVRK